jgi:hypothetical protein
MKQNKQNGGGHFLESDNKLLRNATAQTHYKNKENNIFSFCFRKRAETSDDDNKLIQAIQSTEMGDTFFKTL